IYTLIVYITSRGSILVLVFLPTRRSSDLRSLPISNCTWSSGTKKAAIVEFIYADVTKFRLKTVRKTHTHRLFFSVVCTDFWHQVRSMRLVRMSGRRSISR